MKTLKKFSLSIFLFIVIGTNLLVFLPKETKAAKEPWACITTPQYYCVLAGSLFLDYKPIY